MPGSSCGGRAVVGSPVARANPRVDRLGCLEDLPSVAGEVDLRPQVPVRVADQVRVLGRAFAGSEADRDSGRQAHGAGHHRHGGGELLAEAGPVRLRVEEEVVDDVLANGRLGGLGGIGEAWILLQVVGERLRTLEGCRRARRHLGGKLRDAVRHPRRVEVQRGHLARVFGWRRAELRLGGRRDSDLQLIRLAGAQRVGVLDSAEQWVAVRLDHNARRVNDERRASGEEVAADRLAHLDLDEGDLNRRGDDGTLGGRLGEEVVTRGDCPVSQRPGRIPSPPGVDVVRHRPQVKGPRGSDDHRLVVDAHPLALDDEGGPERIAADPRLGVGEAAEHALELIAHAGPRSVETAPCFGQGCRDGNGGQDPGQGHARAGEEHAGAHDRRWHLQVLVHATALPSVLAVDQRGAQPEQQGGDNEEEEPPEVVGVDRRHVDDDRGAQQQDGVEDAVMAVDRVRGRKGGREHEDAEADGIRSHLRRIADAHDDHEPIEEVRPQGQQATALLELGEVFPADGPQNERRTGDGAEGKGDDNAKPQHAEESPQQHRPDGERRQEFHLLDQSRGLHRPRHGQGHDHEQAEAEPAGARVEEALAQVRHWRASGRGRRWRRRCRRRGAPGGARCRTRPVHGGPPPARRASDRRDRRRCTRHGRGG